MQCRIPRQTMIKPLFDVALSGTFGYHGYVTIDGTQYTSAQTLKVAKGTSVTVYCSGTSQPEYPKIALNGTTVAQGTSSAAAEYTFAVTVNCSIVMTRTGSSKTFYFAAAITMPA